MWVVAACGGEAGGAADSDAGAAGIPPDSPLAYLSQTYHAQLRLLTFYPQGVFTIKICAFMRGWP